MGPAVGRYLGAMVVLTPRAPDDSLRHVGCVLKGVYPGGMLFRNGHGIRLWVSWVDIWTGHYRLEGTADAEAIMALVTASAVKAAARSDAQSDVWSA